MDNYTRPPVAKKIEKKLIKHEHERIDNYYWLKERENPEVIKYLEEENEYTRKTLKHTEKFQDKLYNEIISRIKQDDMSVPYFKNGYYYYTRYEKGKEYPVYCRKKETLESTEEILLNVNELAEGHEYFHATGFSISPNNKLMSFGIDFLGRRQYSLCVKNLETGDIAEQDINNTTGYAVWAKDNKTMFYTHKDEETLRSCSIVKHRVNEPAENDKEIYFEDDSTFGVYVSKSKSEEYIIIGSYSTLSSEYRILKADNPDGIFTVFTPREKEHEYLIYHFKDNFYILTNKNARNFRLMKTSKKATGIENWQEVLPHRDDVYLEDIELFEEHMVVQERSKGLTHLRIFNTNTDDDYYMEFDEEAYVVSSYVNLEFKTNLLTYAYTSLTTPQSVYEFNMDTREQKLLKRKEVVGKFNPSDYESKRHYAPSRDGKNIPISLVYKKGIKLDGSNPALLYGYGSYGHTIDPVFSSVILSLLDRGFVYAIAHIRGGQIYGREWYDDGKMLNKKNTFYDFIDCAEYLIKSQYTSKEKLFAMGGSAGGLLMGSVVNIRPDLFKGIIASVPFVDVVTTMTDETIPLTTGEYDEWGNPNDKQYYDYILSYSPYDNVEAKDYPAMLVTTGLHDSQVQFWEPAKWVAKLRELKTDDNILLLYTNMDAGHGGASGRFKRHKETAMEYAFLFNLVGIGK